MIVYGDPCYGVAAATLQSRMQARLRTLVAQAATVPSLDQLRALLIQAGEFEQAAADAGSLLAQGAAEICQQATDHAATAFAAKWTGHSSQIHGALTAAARAIDRLPALGNVNLQVKVPEGFAFYALYPEQYLMAARKWLADHAACRPRHAIIVGIRSIGTSLSAAVAATLAAGGWHVHRLTIRPSGHPFARTATIPPSAVQDAAWGLIVDEGPGLSGASMAAAARALADAGLKAPAISFFPGHANMPGEAGSDDVRQWWSTARRYVVSLDTARWDGRSLAQALADAARKICEPGNPVARVADLGAGLWRNVVYGDGEPWPAAFARFERPKYLCIPRDGGAVLWKFAGLCSDPAGDQDMAASAFSRLCTRAQRGWTAAPLAIAQGFIAAPWIQGSPLARPDCCPAILEHVGKYLADVAGPPLAPAEQQSAAATIANMLVCNARESLGEPAAQAAQAIAAAGIDALSRCTLPTYGDGRPGPQEFIRAASGQILKVDCAGHDVDHTLIGRQPVSWDIAAAVVEWGLDERAAAPLLHQAVSLLGEMPPALLTFHRAAYAAFRMGQCDVCAAATAYDPVEQQRLRSAQEMYRAELARCLSPAQ